MLRTRGSRYAPPPSPRPCPHGPRHPRQRRRGRSRHGGVRRPADRLGRRPGGGDHRRGRDRRAGVGARAERRRRRVRAQRVREGLARGRDPRSSTARRVVAEFFGTKVDEVFGPENGMLSRELARLFGEGSSVAVQAQLREIMRETSARMREDLLRQFSSRGRLEPAGGLQGRAPAGGPRGLDAPGVGAGGDAGARWSRLKLELAGVALGAREGAGGGRRGRARHRQGPALRGGRRRGGRGHRVGDGRRLSTPSATSAAAAGARATSSWTSTAAPAPPAAGSSSRPRTPGARARRRWPNWTRRWRSGPPTTA